MLKMQLDSLEGLDKSLAGFYEEKEGKFSLKVDGLEDTGALKRAKDYEKTAKQAAEKELAAARALIAERDARLEELTGNTHRKAGDIEALDKSWGEKLAKATGEKDNEIKQRDAWLRDLTVTSAAQGLASELAVEGSAKALLPHIQARLAMDMRDGRPVAVVLGPDGKPSASTLEELKKEFINDAAFAPLIVGTKANGASSNKGKGGGASTGGKTPGQMTLQEKAEFIENHGIDAWSNLLAGKK
jgi:hypothetical protein